MGAPEALLHDKRGLKKWLKKKLKKLKAKIKGKKCNDNQEVSPPSQQAGDAPQEGGGNEQAEGVDEPQE